jgi:hypothetical protein
MSWVTIYDVRSGWGSWVAGALAMILICFGSFMLVACARMFRRATGPAQRRQQLVGIAVLFGSLAFPIGLALWFVVSDYRLRADLNSGRIQEAEGLVDGGHIESSGRSNTMYFRIAELWFRVPFHFSPECFPHNGEPVKVAFEPVADVEHAGPLAHTILKMQLSHGCALPIWG